MRGGQYVNKWRMAQLHAQQAPDRVNELEAWGAVFDRTPDGKILQRNFGGHKYPRLAHVGDRTGLELIRYAARPRHPHQGIQVYMERTVVRLISDGGSDHRVTCLRPRTRSLYCVQAKAIILACGGIGKAYKITFELVGMHRRPATPSPTTPGPNSSTWSSSSSTPRA